MTTLPLFTSAAKNIADKNLPAWFEVCQAECKAFNIAPYQIDKKKGDYVYFDTYQHDKIYFIKEGCIRVGYIDEQGNDVVKEIIYAGAFFGQFTLEKTNLQGEYAQAYKTTASLVAFHISDFEKLMVRRHDIALIYVRHVGKKLRAAQNSIVNMMKKNVRSRLMDYLWNAVQSGKAQQRHGDICIPNQLTHKDIANLIGSSRQTVNGIINSLIAQGVLFCDRKKILIPDINRLQQLVNRQSA